VAAGLHGGGLPKLLTLAAWRGGHPHELDADLRRLYGGTYRQLAAELTCLELAGLAACVPMDASSAIYRASHPRDWWWTPDLELLAGVNDRLSLLLWQGGGCKGEEPSMIARPSDPPVVARGDGFATIEDYKAWRAAHLEGDDTHVE